MKRFYYESDGDKGHRTHYVCDDENLFFRRDFTTRKEAIAWADAANAQALERAVEAVCDPRDYLGEALAELHADRVGVQDQALNRAWISTEEEG